MCLIQSVPFAALVACIFAATPAHAVIFGGTDNRAMDTTGWQEGTAAVFNVPGRIAYWEGPPFGGGQYHSECRGGAEAFNAVLEDFAKIQAATKRLVVHDGIGQSVWLNINRTPEKEEQARMDWAFTTWRLENYRNIQKMPADFRPPDVSPNMEEPVPQIDVYVGGQINWDDVNVPDGITVDDQRLSAHGFSPEDGRVFEGVIRNGKTDTTMQAVVELRQPPTDRNANKEDWAIVKAVETDASGHWVIRNAPSGRLMILATADGFASRIVGYESVTSELGWSRHDSELSKASSVSGRVVDTMGQPLAGAMVHIGSTTDIDGEKYSTPVPSRHEVDAEGRFAVEGVPAGWVSLWPFKEGYTQVEQRTEVLTPAKDLKLEMALAGSVEVEVDFSAYETRKEKRPSGYLVEIAVTPETKQERPWGGSANINDDGEWTFRNVPPGKYILFGRPNPGGRNDETERVTIEVEPGKTSFVTLDAK